VSPNDVGSPLKAIRLTASFQPSLCRAAPQRNGAQTALFYDFLPDTSLSSCRMGSKSCLILSLPCPCCDPAEVGAHKCAPSEQIVTTDPFHQSIGGNGEGLGIGTGKRGGTQGMIGSVTTFTTFFTASTTSPKPKPNP